MCVVISPVLFGGFAMRAMDPIESESPKIRSARVSIRGRGWTPALGCCIDRFQERVAICSFGGATFIVLHFRLLRSTFMDSVEEPRFSYDRTRTALIRDCLFSRIRKEVTRIITPTCSNDPAMKVSDARVGPASA